MGVSSGKVESRYFVGSFSPSGHSMRSHMSGWGAERFQSREAGRTRTAANRLFGYFGAPQRTIISVHLELSHFDGRGPSSVALESGEQTRSVVRPVLKHFPGDDDPDACPAVHHAEVDARWRFDSGTLDRG